MNVNYLMFHTMDPEMAVEDLKEIYRQKGVCKIWVHRRSSNIKIKKLTEVRTCVIVKAGLFCQLFYVSIIRSADDAL